MGTDIYMEWDGKNEEDKKKQITGFSIDAGDIGYLRASMGMDRENQVLGLIFPEKYWDGSPTDEYNFIENYYLVAKILKSYLDGDDLSKLQNAFSEKRFNDLKDMKEKIEGLFSKMDGALISSVSKDAGNKMWANSIVEFFKFGMKLQEEKKKPYVYISY